jgi:hypothetical protein
VGERGPQGHAEEGRPPVTGAAEEPLAGRGAGAEVHRRTDDLVWRELDGEVVLLDLRSSLYLTLNRTGALLWDLLAEPVTPARLAAALVAEFGLSADVAAADTEAFLSHLRAQGLVEPADNG